MRICIIGNSHIGALKNAWSELAAEFPDHVLTFFGSTRDRMAGLSVRGGRLAPGPGNKLLAGHLRLVSGGHDSIRVEDYDVFLVYGLLFRVPPLDTRWSSGLMEALCRDSYRASVNSRIVSMIRQLSDTSIFVGPVPLKTSGARRPLVPAANLAAYDVAAQLVSKAIDGDGLRFLAQPSETVGKGWSTGESYAKGATALVGGSAVADHDTLHMNAKFGELYLRKFFLELSQDTKLSR